MSIEGMGSTQAKRPANSPRGQLLRDLLSGLPALIVGGIVLGVVLGAANAPRNRTISRYKYRGWSSLQRGDLPVAKVCFERLLQEGVDPAETTYGLALTMDALKDPNEAMALLLRAAPLDRPGFLPAHLHLAKLLIRSNPLTTTAVAAAESHLLRVLRKDPGAPSASDSEIAEASSLLGELLVATGRPREALPYLERSVGNRPELRMTLARTLQTLNQPENARAEARKALEEFKTRIASDPDDFTARLRAAEAASILNDFAMAADLLSEGLSRTNDARYRSSLATIHAAWADSLARKQAPLGDRILLLERGLQFDPANAALLERFVRVLQTGGPEAEQVRTRLRALLSQGRATASIHFTLGVDAWLHDQTDTARLHFEQADKLAPRSPIILNNLAWIEAHAKKPDLPGALKMVQYAVERQPDALLYRGTRGVIFTKLKLWRQALPDLEAALSRDPKNADLHLALAECYDQLGDREMAAKHRADAKPAAEKRCGRSRRESPLSSRRRAGTREPCMPTGRR